MSTAELLSKQEYKYGFVTDIESDMIPRGLTEDTIRLIVEKKNEPDWMLEFRLKAFRHWLTMTEPKHWPNLIYPEIDYQNIIYYSAPKQKATKASLDEVDPELLRTFEKLGIPLQEQKQLANVAVDAVFDSVSVATTYKEKLAKVGITMKIGQAHQHGDQMVLVEHQAAIFILAAGRNPNRPLTFGAGSSTRSMSNTSASSSEASRSLIAGSSRSRAWATWRTSMSPEMAAGTIGQNVV